jgi:hypothetical protein
MDKNITQQKLLPMKCKCWTAGAVWMAAMGKGLLARVQVKAADKEAVRPVQEAGLEPRMILVHRHQMTLMMTFRFSKA